MCAGRASRTKGSCGCGGWVVPARETVRRHHRSSLGSAATRRRAHGSDPPDPLDPPRPFRHSVLVAGPTRPLAREHPRIVAQRVSRGARGGNCEAWRTDQGRALRRTASPPTTQRVVKVRLERSSPRAPRLRGPRREWPFSSAPSAPPREPRAVVASRTPALPHPRPPAPPHPRPYVGFASRTRGNHSRRWSSIHSTINGTVLNR